MYGYSTETRTKFSEFKKIRSDGIKFPDPAKVLFTAFLNCQGVADYEIMASVFTVSKQYYQEENCTNLIDARFLRGGKTSSGSPIATMPRPTSH